jgi:4-aminobutyrate aminotransferase-like enzyme
VLDQLEQTGCFGPQGSNARLHAYFAQQLQRLAEKHPACVAGPFGAGMMVAFTPGNGAAKAAKWIVEEAYAEGLMGFLCGSEPTRVRFLPPPVGTRPEHIDAAIEILERVLTRLPAAGL